MHDVRRQRQTQVPQCAPHHPAVGCCRAIHMHEPVTSVSWSKYILAMPIAVQNPRGYNLCSIAERWRSTNVKDCCWWKCLTVTVRKLSAHTCLQCRKDRSLTPCRLNKALGCISLVRNSATHLSNRFMLRYAMLSGRARLDTGGKSFPGSKPILVSSNVRTVSSPVDKRRAALFYP